MLVLDKTRTAEVVGGNARWAARRRADYVPPDGDELGIKLGADGWKEGWEVEKRGLMQAVEFD